MIKILFFARLREQLNTQTLSVEYTDNLTTADIIKQLIIKNPHWEKTLNTDHILVAVNQQVSNWQQIINDGDEVAFFPPVTGG